MIAICYNRKRRTGQSPKNKTKVIAMKKSNLFVKISAVLGTVLIGAPILFMIVTGVVGSVMRGQLMMDYLIPGELFVAVFAGVILLLIAAIVSRTCIRTIAWGSGIALVSLVGTLLYAMLSGLASGAVEPEGLPQYLTLIGIGIYDLSVLLLAIGGTVLCVKLFRAKQHS